MPIQPTADYSPDADWRPLMFAIYCQAIRDLRDKSDTKRADAFMWLASSDGETFLDALGVEYKKPAYIFRNYRKVTDTISKIQLGGRT